MLELERVVKHYRAGGENIRAVDGVSLSVNEGEMVALQGPSGSGKTTLLLLIAALIAPEQGSIRFRGRELSSMSDDDISAYLLNDIGFVHQSFHLMPRVSILENAAMKLLLAGVGMREAQSRALPWLERVGLGGRLAHTPEELSGGERQRVAIARALAPEPPLILADEPTGNLDSTRSKEIAALLHTVALERGAGVLLVTHDSDAASAGDRRHLVRDGKLQAGEEEDPHRSDVPASRASSGGG
jgi:putative ABC transport system ATP-binding protein